jgi:hypothetical protein
VAPYHLPTNCHVSIVDSSTFLPTCLPSQQPTVPSTSSHSLFIYHVSYVCTDLPRQSYGRATCHPCSGDMCHNISGPLSPSTTQSTPTDHCHITIRSYILVHSSGTSTPYRLYRLYNHQIFPVWKNEQIVISWSYDIRLSPFKLRWVHIDEAYTHVRFEEILRTLIFRAS